MSINMQGSWTVSVKSKSAAYPQQFVISGAATIDGAAIPTKTCAGNVGTSVDVTGDNWAITIKNNPGGGWVNSDVRLKFPTVQSGQYQFDIESNDAWIGDQDFNDLILTCSTPQTVNDFLLYGSVHYYKGFCPINPCFRWPYVVIDSLYAFQQAKIHPNIKELIEKLYYDKLPIEPPRLGPWPDPPPFRAMVIPLEDGYALPPKRVQILRVAEPVRKSAAAKRKTGSPQEESAQSVIGMRSVMLGTAKRMEWGVDSIKMGSIVDHLVPYCETGPLPGVVLRFQEYDRTSAELAGGVYTGEGNRENLGVCATDRNGNYIFRFSRSIAQFIEESILDVATGEDEVAQAQPDIIVQVLDPMATTGVAYESAPYWNVPLLKRINLCVPEITPTACQGGKAIQAIGDIFIGEPQPDGTRVGYNNFLGADGRITAKSAITGVPQARCAAWGGNLALFACFQDLPVKYYTIKYRWKIENPSPGSPPWSEWYFYLQKYLHPKVANIGQSGYSGDPVGPNPPGAPFAEAYLNIENDEDWVSTHRNRKAIISSWLYAQVPGAVEFHIEGYRANGNKIGAADDTIRLFIDNSAPDFRILDVTMQGQAGGDCALFVLPEGQLNAPLTVEFKANQMQGFMNAYGLSVRKGNIPGFNISGYGPGAINGAYVHGDDLICNQFWGTLDDPTNIAGVVTADIKPASGDWLDADQPFCTFAVNLGCSKRVTNGYNQAVYSYGPVQYLLGIQQPE